MSILSNLKFSSEATRPTPTIRATPLEKAKANLLSSIGVQKALLNGESLSKVVKDEDGSTRTVQRKPRFWFWRNEANGVFFVEVLHGNRGIALNGKQTVIEAGTTNESVSETLSQIGEAIQAGELDAVIQNHISTTAKNRKAGRPKKAS